MNEQARTVSQWPKPAEYRTAINAAFAAMQQLGLSKTEQAQVFQRIATKQDQLRVVREELGDTKFQNMDVLDRSKYLAEISRVALQHFKSPQRVHDWLQTKENGVSPKQLLLSGHLYLVVAVLLQIQHLCGIGQDPKMVEFVQTILAMKESQTQSGRPRIDG